MPRKKTEILIVEDDPMQVLMYSIEFEQFNYNVLLARDGKTGLKSIQDLKPKIVLLDLLLGDMNGTDVLRALRDSGKIKDINIIVMTNFTKKGLSDECLELGAKAFLVKSEYTPRELVKKITDEYL
ncbi:response regulator [Patescibacteria group bacterium]|nr:response regulator [Patescibacteria group bacterium]